MGCEHKRRQKRRTPSRRNRCSRLHHSYRRYAAYAEASDEYLAEASETRTVEPSEKTFRKAMIKASGLNIPPSRIQHFQPSLPASAKSLSDERGRCRGLYPADESLNDLNKLILNLMLEDKRTKCQSAVDNCIHRADISHPWRPVKGLRGIKPHYSPNVGVRFIDKTYLDLKIIAIEFAQQFTRQPMRLTGDMSDMSTITADITAGFSREKPAHRRVLVAHDMSAAFDNVDNQHLLDCVFNASMPATIRRSLNNYDHNRRANVHFRQQESKSREVKTVVVQSGVLNPSYINYYLADFPTLPPNMKLIKYADDITIYTSGPVVADLINGLSIYLSHVLNDKRLRVSASKSTVTLFTPDTHVHHQHHQVKLAEQVLPLEKMPK